MAWSYRDTPTLDCRSDRMGSQNTKPLDKQKHIPIPWPKPLDQRVCSTCGSSYIIQVPNYKSNIYMHFLNAEISSRHFSMPATTKKTPTKQTSFKIIFHTGISLLFAHLSPTKNLRFNTSGYLPEGKLVKSLWLQSIYFNSDLNNLFWSCIVFAPSRTFPGKK